ncbi:MAG: hypothetical protein ACFFDN_30970 [Candidatus Hodarchaeota archaeon]
MVALKGIGLTIFIFVGAITMTFFSVQIVMMDSQWHFGQRLTQAAVIDSLRMYYYSEEGLNGTTFIIPENFTKEEISFLTLAANMDEVEHAIIGQSPSSYLLWFVGFFFMFLIIGGILGYMISETDINPLALIGFIGFVVAGAVISTFIAIYIITIDAQWHLRSEGLIAVLLNTTLPDENLLFYYLTFQVIGSWTHFEHSVGQSASSYVIWFIIFIIIYPIVGVVLIWILKRR